MAKSRRTEKQQLMRDYDAFIQAEMEETEKQEAMRQEAEDVYLRYIYELAEKETYRRQTEAFNNDFERCWQSYDPY